MTRPPVPRRPMSSEEREMAKHLGRCSFLPATPAKRFAGEIAGRAQLDEPEISESEAGYLRGLVYTFRRQIPADVVTLAGDVPKQREARLAQQRSIAERQARQAKEDRALPVADPAVLSLFGEIVE